MRRLVVELFGKELERRTEGTPFEKIKSMEMVHLLKLDQDENAAIWRMTLKDPSAKVQDCFKSDRFTKELQVLETGEDGEGRGHSYLVLLRRVVRPGLLLGSATRPESGYLSGPMGIKDGRIRFTFIGTQRQIKAILDGADERGFQYKVVSLTDADLAEDSLLNRLTDRQRKILVLAFKLGYFDVPKKLNSDDLASRLHLTGSTVVEHLSKAERRILAGIIDEQPVR